MTSGLPVNLSYSPSSTFSVSGAPTYRPNLIGDVYGERTIDNYFNKDNVVIPTDRTQPFGNAPRNVARGPAIYSLDLGLHKGFGLGLGDSRLEFRIEAFNALNKTNFGAPNGNRSSTDFGTILYAVDAAAADSARGESGFLVSRFRGLFNRTGSGDQEMRISGDADSDRAEPNQLLIS